MSDVDKEAHDRAHLVHPKPKHDPIEYGLQGGAISCASVVLFTGFAGLDIEQFVVPLVFTLVIFFGAPYFYYRHQESKYLTRYYKERDDIKARNTQKHPSEF